MSTADAPHVVSRDPGGTHSPARAGSWSTIVWIAGTVLLAVGVIALIGYLGLKKEYSQATPDETLKSAIAMVKDGKATRLADLFYADNVEYRATLTRLGHLFGTMQDLGASINRRFPKEVATLRASLEAKAKGQQGAIIQKLNEGVSLDLGAAPGKGGALRIDIGPPKDAAEARAREDAITGYASNLFADPFGWLSQGADKLSVEKSDDETAVLKFDGEAILGGVLTLKQRDGKWWFVLPLQLPMVSAYAPQTRNEWTIVASLIRAADNALVDLKADVDRGKVSRLENLAQAAGEKAFLPAGAVMLMYGKEMDVRMRREKALASFKKRWREWEKTRLEDPAVVRAMSDAVHKAAIEGLDKLIRRRAAETKRTPMPVFENMPQDELLPMVEGWLTAEGAKGISLTSPLSRAIADQAGAAIDAHAKSGIRVKPQSLK